LMLLTPFALTTNAQVDNTWHVKTDKAKCILRNINIYLQQSSDPVIIYVDICPKTDLDAATNVGLPNIRANKALKNNAVEAVLVYTKKELRCLSKFVLKEDRKFLLKEDSLTTSLPAKPCALEERSSQ